MRMILPVDATPKPDEISERTAFLSVILHRWLTDKDASAPNTSRIIALTGAENWFRYRNLTYCRSREMVNKGAPKNVSPRLLRLNEQALDRRAYWVASVPNRTKSRSLMPS